ncbi:PrsW family intramembrane metalloprotease [Streptomyces sp. ST2-7A]|uniref:PrsW family intramembrane metalloprotease n=1 Tax=Streptomyces sp. ST2-7A TaxID=2907214 RepID=UPI001F207714|nr:PrsW family intramembrane metalloprotease [Streptomyces sp. ST2-7A]MCE7080911.1 PrsW family intramembrane metalloprotease [Streptomyces sp. ST2-7A]
MAVPIVLTVCGGVVLALIGQETGAFGMVTGLALAALPVPLMVALLHRTASVDAASRTGLVFALGWGACAATLVALVANGVLVQWLLADPAGLPRPRADALELTLVAPVVEECAKGAAVLLLWLHRPRAVHGVLAGVCAAAMAAVGFAFTENVLYLGRAAAEDRLLGTPLVDSTAAATFLVRVVLAPFAHPLFTALTGIGLGLAVVLPRRRRVARVVLPWLGLLCAIGLHSAWNGATGLGTGGFLMVYGLVMFPALALVIGVCAHARRRQLRAVREMLPHYAGTGRPGMGEYTALGTSRGRSLTRRLARRDWGPATARAVIRYQDTATELALLRDRAERHGGTGSQGAAGDFARREAELLWRLARDRGPGATRSLRGAALVEVRPTPPPARDGRGAGAVPPPSRRPTVRRPIGTAAGGRAGRHAARGGREV